MEGFSFVTPVTGLNRPNTGKEDDDDDDVIRNKTRRSRVLWRTYGPNRDEVTGAWRKLHNEEVNLLYSSPDNFRQIKSRRMRWVRHVARMGEDRTVYRVLAGKPEGKRPLGNQGRTGSEWILGRLAGRGVIEWIQMAQDRGRWRSLVNTVMNLRVLEPQIQLLNYNRNLLCLLSRNPGISGSTFRLRYTRALLVKHALPHVAASF
jgi:hypothetical protein